MNQHLQAILNFIQRAEHLSDEEKAALLKAAKAADKELEITSFKLERTEKVKHTTAVLLEETIEELEKKRKDIEAQNRELEIESSLEKVRTVAMSMRKRDDMLDICRTISQQLESLGIREIRNVQTAIFYQDKGTYVNYEYYRLHDKALVTEVDYTNDEISIEFAAQMIKGSDEVFIRHLEGQQVKDWLNFQKTTNVFIDTNLEKARSLTYQWFSLGPVAIGTSTYDSLSKTEIELFKRFRNVFELAYRRYLDIEKAEAQAREAQIQLALERVRARTMAMQHSEELMEASNLLLQQVQSLGIPVWACGYNIWEIGEKVCTAWMSVLGAIQPSFRLPLTEHRTFIHMYESRLKEEPFYVEELSGEDLADHYRYMFSLPDFKEIATKQLQAGFPLPQSQIHHVFNFKDGNLVFLSAEAIPGSWDIFNRFTAVFEQTYTRFLDLQTAEAQAREAQIQLALERVRARTMAMQKSDELTDVAELLFKQVNNLGIKTWTTGFNVWSDDNNFYTDYVTNPQGGFMSPYTIDAAKLPGANKASNAKKRGDEFLVSYEEGEALAETYRQLTKFGEKQFKSILESGFEFPSHQYEHFVFGAKVSLLFITYDPVPEAHLIFKRFGKVFEQTYTRFLDLQKAEAQARESQIQLALERVRARTMAMQRSDELSEAASLLFKQVQSLGAPSWTAGYCIWDEDKKAITLWMSSPSGGIQPPFRAPLDENPTFIRYLEADNKGMELYIEEESGKVPEENYQYLLTLPVVGELLNAIMKEGYPLPTYQVDHCAYFSKGFLLFITYQQVPELHDIFKRFAAVFDQTYTRFLDLQKAEAQAREAQIEAALERVRARAMAMHKSEELKEVANELRKQVGLLGQGELETCAIHLYDESPDYFESWAALLSPNEQGEVIQARSQFPKRGVKIIEEMLECYARHKQDYVLINEGAKAQQFFEMVKQKAPDVFEVVEKSMKEQAPEDKRAYWSVADFAGGSLVMTTMVEPGENSRALLRRFANVFGLAYRRFVDLKKAEAQAREAQIQLALERVRARTMAMQKSEELREVVAAIYEQLQQLGFVQEGSCNINIMDVSTGSVDWWMTGFGNQKYPHRYHVEYINHPVHITQLAVWKSGKKYTTIEVAGESKKEFDKLMLSQADFEKISEETKTMIASLDRVIFSMAFMKYGALSWAANPITDEQAKILQRFARVFEQTYTRFLDLQKAEAQAKEAQIQLALERVRARTMAMQHSDELKKAAALLFQQVKALGVPAYSCGYNIWEKNEKEFTSWMSTQDGSEINGVPNIPLTEDANFIRYVASKQQGEPFFVLELRDERMQEHYQYLKAIPAFKGYFDYAVSVGFELPKTQIHHIANFSQGNLLFITLEPCPEFHDVFKRFAAVFEQTYTRFLDLQKAEAQARESQIQLALERVRASTMAMQKSDELPGTAAILFEQFKSLGQELMQMTIGIVNEADRVIEFSVTDWSGSGAGVNRAFNLSIDEPTLIKKMYTGWKKNQGSIVVDLTGKELEDWINYRNKMSGVTINSADTSGRRVITTAFFSRGHLSFSTSAQPAEGSIRLLERFAQVFDLTYTRFLDLQKAEAQARESQIELGLERVRARAMAMQKSDELSELVDTVFKELTKLDFALTWCIINIIDEASMSNVVWAANPDIDKAPDCYHMKFEDYPFHHAMMKGWKERKTKYVYVLEGLEKKIYDEYLFTETEFRKVPEAAQAASRAMEKYVVSFSFSNFGGLQTVGDVPLPDDSLDILGRFGKVFDLTYTRFNDLKQAEAQARESQIEAALERVRSRSMGMQKSGELKDVIQVVYEQFVHLNIHVEHTGFIMDYKERDDMHIWLADKRAVPFQVTIPYFDCAHWNSFNEAKEKGKDFFANHLSFEEKNRFYRDLFKLIPGVPQETLGYYFSCPGLAISTVLLDNVGLYIENFSGTPYSEEENKTLMRFGKVFQQTYTRFLDLQKVEAQAREARIETALERVRSRTMAMQKSDELRETVLVLYEQLQHLNFNSNACNIIIIDKETNNAQYWVSGFSQEIFPESYAVPYLNHPYQDALIKPWKEGDRYVVYEYTGKMKQSFDKIFFTQTDFRKVPEEAKSVMIGLKSVMLSTAFTGYGALQSLGPEPLSEENANILQRFAKVFEQTYTRFLDLQKAEAQAREAKIETALEKVRSRTMAMQRSAELAEVATVLFQQVKALGVPQWTCGFGIFEIDDKEFTWYPGGADGEILQPCKIPLTEHPVFISFNEARKRGDELFVYEKEGEFQADHYRYMMSLPGMRELLQNMLDAGFSFPTFQIDHIASFSHGNLVFITYEPFPEMHDVFKRFAKVFDQTYTRFLDLQKSEAQAREAIKQASVDRIRAEIASMRTINDLERIQPLIWNELTTLGVPFIRCGVFIMDEKQEQVQSFLSTPDGKSIAAFRQPYNSPGEIAQIVEHWHRKKIYKQHWSEADFIEFTKNLVKQGAITSGEKYLTENRPTDLYLHFLPFMQGMLYAGCTTALSDDELQLVQNLADAFATAYARYEDFNKLEVAKQQIEMTLVDLKQAQQQLVQSEKMASLGELTAGIAHEIQNPLNFVNNFSDVNTELVDELKSELAIGNMQLANEIADNIKDNEQKINHHGKRADAIVKNMLQHSRSSGAAKELTDINKLADEYLRLSYHGLRAKDKSFNADFKTELDSSVGKINVISQDIGRVLLNLINNAFYATNEKKKTAGENYKPLVSVLTKKINNNIEIAVADNGKGIPQKIADKIFQPFFTTKPTGQGTGLGLSLAYDIIKAHGGEIKVESKEGEGSVFIIRLTV